MVLDNVFGGALESLKLLEGSGAGAGRAALASGDVDGATSCDEESQQLQPCDARVGASGWLDAHAGKKAPDLLVKLRAAEKRRRNPWRGVQA